MTITALNYVYGFAVKELDFIKWVIANPDCIWYDEHELIIENLKEYCDDQGKNSDVAYEFILNIKEDMGNEGNLQSPHVGVFEMSHDQCKKLVGRGQDAWLVIGQRQAFINLQKAIHPLVFDVKKNPMTDNPVLESEMAKLVGLVNLRECKYFLMQDDCACCS